MSKTLCLKSQLHKILIILLITLLTFACTETNTSNPHLYYIQMPVKYGNLETNPVFDAVAAIYLNNTMLCSLTLVTPSLALSAAHCFYEFIPPAQTSFPDFTIKFHNPESNLDITTKPLNIILHPEYHPTSPQFDIALITLPEPIPTHKICPIPIDANPQNTDYNAINRGFALKFIGFGVDENYKSEAKKSLTIPIDLQCDNLPCELTIQITPKDFQPYLLKEILPPNTLLHKQSNGGPCTGDSGGPGIIQMNSKIYLSAITSYGDKQCEVYGVSTKVAPYMNFILNNLDQNIINELNNPSCYPDLSQPFLTQEPKYKNCTTTKIKSTKPTLTPLLLLSLILLFRYVLTHRKRTMNTNLKR